MTGRQFANVSYSPWTLSPHAGATNNTNNYYATAAPKPQQPAFRRIILPPAPIFYHPGVEQVIGEDSDDDDQAGGAPVVQDAPPPPPPPPPPPEAIPVEIIEALPPPPPPPPPPPAAPEEAPVNLFADIEPEPPATEAASEAPSQPEEETDPKSEEANVEATVIVEDVKDEPSGTGDPGDTVAVSEIALPPPPPPPPPPQESPEGNDSNIGLIHDEVAIPSDTAPPLPPAQPAESVPEPDVAKSEKSGESEQAAQEPPKSPVEKSVHFSSDTKDSDAASIGKKRKELLYGKGKPTAFVRLRKPAPVPSPPPPPPKEPKKKVITPIGIIKKKERSNSILSVSSIEKPVTKADSAKSKSGKVDERKKKRDDKKVKGKGTKKDNDSTPSDARSISESTAVESIVSSDVADQPEEVAEMVEVVAASDETLVDVQDSGTLEAPPQSEDSPVLETSAETNVQPTSESPTEQESTLVDDDVQGEISSTSEATTESDVVAISETSLETGDILLDESPNETLSEPTADTSEASEASEATPPPPPLSEESAMTEEPPAEADTSSVKPIPELVEAEAITTKEADPEAQGEAGQGDSVAENQSLLEQPASHEVPLDIQDSSTAIMDLATTEEAPIETSSVDEDVTSPGDDSMAHEEPTTEAATVPDDANKADEESGPSDEIPAGETTTVLAEGKEEEEDPVDDAAIPDLDSAEITIPETEADAAPPTTVEEVLIVKDAAEKIDVSSPPAGEASDSVEDTPSTDATKEESAVEADEQAEAPTPPAELVSAEESTPVNPETAVQEPSDDGTSTDASPDDESTTDASPAVEPPAEISSADERPADASLGDASVVDTPPASDPAVVESAIDVSLAHESDPAALPPPEVVYDTPTTSESAADEAEVDKIAADKSAVDEPIVVEPVINDCGADKPALDACPIAEPAAEDPTSEEPTMTESVAEESVGSLAIEVTSAVAEAVEHEVLDLQEPSPEQPEVEGTVLESNEVASSQAEVTATIEDQAVATEIAIINSEEKNDSDDKGDATSNETVLEALQSGENVEPEPASSDENVEVSISDNLADKDSAITTEAVHEPAPGVIEESCPTTSIEGDVQEPSTDVNAEESPLGEASEVTISSSAIEDPTPEITGVESAPDVPDHTERSEASEDTVTASSECSSTEPASTVDASINAAAPPVGDVGMTDATIEPKDIMGIEPKQENDAEPSNIEVLEVDSKTQDDETGPLDKPTKTAHSEIPTSQEQGHEDVNTGDDSHESRDGVQEEVTDEHIEIPGAEPALDGCDTSTPGENTEANIVSAQEGVIMKDDDDEVSEPGLGDAAEQTNVNDEATTILHGSDADMPIIEDSNTADAEQTEEQLMAQDTSNSADTQADLHQDVNPEEFSTVRTEPAESSEVIHDSENLQDPATSNETPLKQSPVSTAESTNENEQTAATQCVDVATDATIVDPLSNEADAQVLIEELPAADVLPPASEKLEDVPTDPNPNEIDHAAVAIVPTEGGNHDPTIEMADESSTNTIVVDEVADNDAHPLPHEAEIVSEDDHDDESGSASDDESTLSSTVDVPEAAETLSSAPDHEEKGEVKADDNLVVVPELEATSEVVDDAHSTISMNEAASDASSPELSIISSDDQESTVSTAEEEQIESASQIADPEPQVEPPTSPPSCPEPEVTIEITAEPQEEVVADDEVVADIEDATEPEPNAAFSDGIFADTAVIEDADPSANDDVASVANSLVEPDDEESASASVPEPVDAPNPDEAEESPGGIEAPNEEDSVAHVDAEEDEDEDSAKEAPDTTTGENDEAKDDDTSVAPTSGEAQDPPPDGVESPETTASEHGGNTAEAEETAEPQQLDVSEPPPLEAPESEEVPEDDSAILPESEPLNTTVTGDEHPEEPTLTPDEPSESDSPPAPVDEPLAEESIDDQPLEEGSDPVDDSSAIPAAEETEEAPPADVPTAEDGPTPEQAEEEETQPTPSILKTSEEDGADPALEPPAEEVTPDADADVEAAPAEEVEPDADTEEPPAEEVKPDNDTEEAPVDESKPDNEAPEEASRVDDTPPPEDIAPIEDEETDAVADAVTESTDCIVVDEANLLEEITPESEPNQEPEPIQEAEPTPAQEPEFVSPPPTPEDEPESAAAETTEPGADPAQADTLAEDDVIEQAASEVPQPSEVIQPLEPTMEDASLPEPGLSQDAVAVVDEVVEAVVVPADVESVIDSAPTEPPTDATIAQEATAPAEEEVTESVLEVVDAPVMDVGATSDTQPLESPLADEPPVSFYDGTPKERDFAILDEPIHGTPPREKTKRRSSHTQRESKHQSHRRRESEASATERPTFPGLAMFGASKLASATKSKRRDSITERDPVKGRERLRETEKTASSSDKERAYPEYRSSRHREVKGDDKYSKRRALEEMENDSERRRRHEARRADKERIAAEEMARVQAEDEVRQQERRERRRAARLAEEEVIRAQDERRKAKEDERKAREEEERKIRHEKRRQRHEAEKEALRLEHEAELEALEAKRLRRQRRAERERGDLPTTQTQEEPALITRDGARRAAEEDDEPVARSSTPPPVVVESPRSAPRRRLSTREAPPVVKRSSLFGGVFGRSKADPVPSPSRSVKLVARVRKDPAEVVEIPAREPRMEKERPTSSHQSSNESRDRAERSHRSRRYSETQRPRRQFKSAEEEADYYKRKEARRSMRPKEHEMSGGRDGGVSLPPPTREPPPPPPPESFEPGPELGKVVRIISPTIDDTAMIVGATSTSSAERYEHRRSRRQSNVEERPKSRRISINEKERPTNRRIESDRPRTKERGEERPRPRRGETEYRSSGSHRKKKEESSGLKGLFGGLKKTFS